MYNQKVDCTLHELQQMIEETPVYISELGLIPLEKIENFEQFKETPLYSDYVLLIHTSLVEEEGMEYLAAKQGDINFFIPSAELINEISAKGYEASAPVYKKLRTFLKNRLKFNFEEAEKWCVEVWTACNENISSIELFENMQIHGIDSKNDKVINELMNIIADAYSNTRVIENRGHTLNEIERYSNFSVDADLELNFSKMMNDAMEKMREMGYSESDILEAITEFGNELMGEETKVGRNDPCPCGSGKKYKKCCGK